VLGLLDEGQPGAAGNPAFHAGPAGRVFRRAQKLPPHPIMIQLSVRSGTRIPAPATTGRQCPERGSFCVARCTASPAGARHRPAPGKWSALEYGCHVRDVLRLYDRRLWLMLTQEGPQYPNWDQDATAVADRYDEQDPATVAAELIQAAETIAARFEALSPASRIRCAAWLALTHRGH
jgi:DinB superfamily